MEPEGVDSEGVPMKLSRYALFLEMYVHLHYSEKHLREETLDPQADQKLKPLVRAWISGENVPL